MMNPTRALMPALFLLSACGGGASFEYTPLKNYTKPGVSAAQKKADVRECEAAFQSAGGAVAKNVSLQEDRTRECMRKRGYRRQPAKGTQGSQ